MLRAPGGTAAGDDLEPPQSIHEGFLCEPCRATTSHAGDLATATHPAAPTDPAAPAAAPGKLLVIPDTAFFRLTEREFGMPGLVAIESIGPFVEHAIVGPILTIHDSTLAPGLGIGHHPHRGNERLFYILRGEIRHDDSLNRITGVMGEGDPPARPATPSCAARAPSIPRAPEQWRSSSRPSPP